MQYTEDLTEVSYIDLALQAWTESVRPALSRSCIYTLQV